MQRKTSKSIRSQKYLELSKNIRFWSPVARDGWIIKFSVHQDSEILLIIISQYTGQTLVRYFSDEVDAVKFINFISTKDSSELLEGDENPA